mmetsp:Transcript_26806/g.36934  ORF Transcript_26806/g.36934 Transcript_26806/m.36934 type:complete len:177 (-) Transcript_26806:72-602(-)
MEDNRLLEADMQQIRTIWDSNGGTRRIMPANGKIWPANRCIRLTSQKLSNLEATNSIAVDYFLSLSLLKADFLWDLASSCDDVCWPLKSVSHLLIRIIEPQKRASTTNAVDFLHWCSVSQPIPPTLPIAIAYTFALWMLVKPFISENDEHIRIKGIQLKDQDFRIAHKELRKVSWL